MENCFNRLLHGVLTAFTVYLSYKWGGEVFALVVIAFGIGINNYILHRLYENAMENQKSRKWE